MADKVICGPCAQGKHRDCKREVKGDDYSMNVSCACDECQKERALASSMGFRPLS